MGSLRLEEFLSLPSLPHFLRYSALKKKLLILSPDGGAPMVKIRKYRIPLTAALPVILFMSCRMSVPIREMTDAKKGIADAQKAKADKYAGDELESAVKKLFDSQDRLAKKDADGAKKSAEESANLALAAYNRAVPLLARDAIAVAEKSF